MTTHPQDFECHAYKDVDGKVQFTTIDVKAEIAKVMGGDVEAFAHLPDSVKTVDMCIWVLGQNPELYVHVPKSKITHELMDIVWNHPKFDDGFEYDFAAFVQHTPEHLLNSDYVVHAMEMDFRTICYVPKHFLTPQVLFDYIESNGSNISYVPDELITLDLCKASLNASGGDSIHNIPMNFLDSDMYLAAIQLGTYLSLDDIPEEYIAGNLRIWFIENDYLDALQIGAMSKLSELEMFEVFNNYDFYQSLQNDFSDDSVLDDYPERRVVIDEILSYIKNSYPEAWSAFELGCNYQTVSGLLKSKQDCKIEPSPIPVIN